MNRAKFGGPKENRTPIYGVTSRYTDHYTMGPKTILKHTKGIIVDLILLGLRGQVTTIITARRSAAFLKLQVVSAS